MFGFINRFFRRENGVAAMELGLVTPIFLMMFLSVTELGHMIYYSITIEKGMRSGITYLARATQNGVAPTTEMKDKTRFLVTTATIDGMGDYLVLGYEQALDVDGEAPEDVIVITRTVYDASTPGVPASVDVVTVDVYVPYVPLMPFVTDNIMGTFSPVIHLRHEQAVIGD